jgi:hypothetical protein
LDVRVFESSGIDWLRANRAKYADQWVVVEGDRLIAAHSDARQAYDTAKEAGIEVPFLIHVLPEDSLPFVPAWI